MCSDLINNLTLLYNNIQLMLVATFIDKSFNKQFKQIEIINFYCVYCSLIITNIWINVFGVLLFLIIVNLI